MSHFAKVENNIVTEVIVAEQDFRTQAGAQDISSAVMNKLASLGESDINIASIMASFDASNPLSVDVDQIIQQAKSLTSGTTTGLLNDYAGLKRTAINYQMSQPFMNSYFGRDSALNLNRLAKIQNDKFDSNAYFDNPVAYLDLQEEQARGNIPQSALDQNVTADVWNEMTDEEQALFN